MALADDGADIGLLIQGIAHHHAIHRILHGGDEAVKNRPFHINARRRGAALPLAREAHGSQRAGDRLVEIAIGKDDHRAFAAQFQRNRDQLFSGSAIDNLAGLNRPGEGHLLHQRMRHQRRAAFRAKAAHHIEHTRRQHAVHDFANAEHRKRRFFCAFHHHGIARHQRRRHFQRHQQHRHIPGNDGAHHAEWLTHRDRQHIGREGHAFALQFAAKPAEEFENIGDNIGFHAAFRAQSLAGFKRDQPAQFIHMFLQQRGALMHQGAALARRHLGPFLLRLGGIGHRRIHIRRIAFRRTGHFNAGGRVHHGEAFAAPCGHIGAADEMQAGQRLGEREGVCRRGGRGGVRAIQHGGWSFLNSRQGIAPGRPLGNGVLAPRAVRCSHPPGTPATG